MTDQPLDLTVNDVENVAAELLAQNGHTTTLEIKNELRSRGFRAYQSDVAQAMYLVWQVNGWHWTFNGTYRTYYPDFDDARDAYIEALGNDEVVEQTSWLGWLVAQPAYHAVAAPVPAPAPSPQPAQPAPDPVPDSFPEEVAGPDAQPGDWIVFPYDGSQPSIFVTGIFEPPAKNKPLWTKARNIARNFGANHFSVPYANVGANVVSS